MNHALHMMAVTQIRNPGTAGRRYYEGNAGGFAMSPPTGTPPWRLLLCLTPIAARPMPTPFL
jgi:hypothetical protein